MTTYAHNPIDALIAKAQYLCHKHQLARQGNAWTACWRVWCELCTTARTIWPTARTTFHFSVYADHRMGMGASTVAEGRIVVVYCNGLGEETGRDTFALEWYTPLAAFQGNDEWVWEFLPESLPELQNQEPLRRFDASIYPWTRRIVGRKMDDATMGA